MIENESIALQKLGLNIVDMQHNYVDHNMDLSEIEVVYSVKVDQHVFGPTIRLMKIVEMLGNSKNPQIEEQFNHLVTMLFLTEDKDG